MTPTDASGRPPIAARDHVLAGCLSFTVFVGLAWVCAVANDHHLKATLSEMVRDWRTPEGKIFLPALLLPAIFFLLSGYPYVLENAHAEPHPYGHFFTALRHFGVNSGLIIVALVPTLDVELRENSAPEYEAQVYVHTFGATLAFVSFVLSEAFVLSCSRWFDNKDNAGELRWRTRSLSLMTACLLLLAAHKVLYLYNIHPKYSEAWTFRYEMLLGSGLITQTQLIWHFIDPDPTPMKNKFFYVLTSVPYVGVLFVIAADFTYRANEDGAQWIIMEAALLAIVTCLTTFIYHRTRAWSSGGRDSAGGSGYGATSA